MTKTTNELVQLKLQVINYHSGENTDYLQKSIARDACYTSHNSVLYKRKQIADETVEMETAMKEDRELKANSISRKIDRMEGELAHLIDRHQADRDVYCIMHDGIEWSPQGKSRNVTGDLAKKIAHYKKLVAA